MDIHITEWKFISLTVPGDDKTLLKDL